MVFDPSKPVCTRDGRDVTVVSIDDHVCCGPYHYPIRARVRHPRYLDIYLYLSFRSNGQLKSGDNRSCHDLINRRIWHDWLDDHNKTTLNALNKQ